MMPICECNANDTNLIDANILMHTNDTNLIDANLWLN